MNIEEERDEWRKRALTAESLIGHMLIQTGDIFIPREQLERGIKEGTSAGVEYSEDGYKLYLIEAND